ncbi:MAG: hypothetical protein N2544_16175 [Burkholderiales bacterium]|nr:hypothetical protein [Burkholderiales bacterium]
MRDIDVSVTELERRCLEIIRRVGKTGRAVAITRRGEVVAGVAHSSAPSATRDAAIRRSRSATLPAP